MTRDDLGRIVRSAWIEWALQQPTRKPSWLTLYDELSEPDKEADRQIAEAVLVGVGWQPMRMEWRLKGGTFPPHEDTWSVVDYWTGLQIAEVPEKYEVRALYAMLAQEEVASAPAARAAVLEPSARPLDEWSEEDGNVVWWCWRDGAWLGEPAYLGTPLDLGQTVEVTVAAHRVDKLMRAQVGGWPGYHTHWTPHPSFPAALKEKT